MDRQAVRDWLHRYNAEGPEGLRDRPRGGTACFLDDGQLAVVRGWMESGPDVETRWRGSVARSRHALEDRGGLRSGLCGRERSPAAPEGGVSLRFGAPGASAGLCGGAVGVPVRVPVSRDGAAAVGVRGGRGVSPGGSVVPGRGPGWPKGHDVAPVGAARGAPARCPRPSLRLRLSVRSGVRGARQGGGPGIGAGRHGGDEPAFGGYRRSRRAGKRRRVRDRAG